MIREELPDSTDWLLVEWAEDGECLLQAPFFMTPEGMKKEFYKRRAMVNLNVARMELYKLENGQITPILWEATC